MDAAKKAKEDTSINADEFVQNFKFREFLK
jgi:hypothetical protein